MRNKPHLGFEIKFRGQKYVVNYPDEIWQKYPQEAKDVLFDNLVYSETIHLPLTFPPKQHINTIPLHHIFRHISSRTW